MWLGLKTGKMIPILQATKSVTNISISFTLTGSAFYHNYSKTMVYIELKKKTGFCLTHKAYDFFRPGKASLTMTVPSSTKNSSFTPWDFKYAAICFAPSIPRTFLKNQLSTLANKKRQQPPYQALSFSCTSPLLSLSYPNCGGGGEGGEEGERGVGGKEKTLWKWLGVLVHNLQMS